MRRDYKSLTSASAMAEIVEKITPEREGAFSTYALLVGGLRALSEDKGDAVLPAFLIKLLSISGFHPELRSCAGCGDQTFLGGFSPALGGAVCEVCWTEDQDALGIPADRIALMSSLLASEFGLAAPGESLDEVTNALRRYAEYHLERPLRSLQMMRAV